MFWSTFSFTIFLLMFFALFTNILKIYELPKTYFRRHAETRCAENISARLGSAWHASVLDEENIAVLKQLYY